MRPIFRKFLAAALSAALLAAPMDVFASDALGHDLLALDTPLAQNTALGTGTFWSDSKSDFRRETYVVYTPNSQVTPVVADGDTTRSLTTTLAAAQTLEAQGLRVIAGINGDYYAVADGVPLGSTMTDGVLRNANGDPHYAVGFRADGTALIGDPKLSLSATIRLGETPEAETAGGTDGENAESGTAETVLPSPTDDGAADTENGESVGEDAENGESAPDRSIWDGKDFPIFAFNHIRQSDYGVFLYDSLFNEQHTMDTTQPGVDVVCSVVDGSLAIGGALTLHVDEVLPEASGTVVPEGKYVLTSNLRAGEYYNAPLRALLPGDELTVRVTSGAGEAWNDVRNLVGAPELLVQNGAVCEGLPTGAAPRTAIGQKADGTLLFYTMDGRQSGYSVGATLSAVAMRLVELGCVTAVALDGGGSTTMAATLPHETAARIVNAPSEGSLRAVSNHVFLVAPNAPSGLLDHIYLAPAQTRALPNAQVALTAAAIDTNGIPMRADVTLAADAGTLSGNVLTLPETTGTVHVTASSGGVDASVAIDVLEPEWITVYDGKHEVKELIVAPDSSVSLTAKGFYLRLPLADGKDCFTWRYEGEGVTLTEDGALVAGPDSAVGTLTVSAAGKELVIPVTVARRALQTLEDYEAGFAPVTDVTEETPDAAPHLTLSHASDAAHVKFGRGAAKLDYTLDGENVAVLPVAWRVPSGYDRVTLWICGDGGAASLALETSAGTSDAVTLDFSGWKLVEFVLPAGATAVTGISLRAEQEAAGSIWFDQAVLSYAGAADDAAPVVTLELDEETGTLAGRAFDAVNGAALPRVSLRFDGEELAFSRNERSGEFTALAPEADGHAHWITLVAGDAAGNLARTSLFVPAAPDLEPAFPDAAEHWAAGYIDYLKRAGISNGSREADGTILFRPDSRITRQEFATMLYRFLAPEGDFSGVELPFADTGLIGDWALDAARAMYALGVVNGTKDPDGTLRYDPASDITRQEAATMLGRLLEKGYAAPALTYADSDAIPDWAAGHVALLGASGVFDDFAGDTFSPAVPITRAEMAAMLLRIN